MDVITLPYQFNIAKIKHEVSELIQHVGLHEHHNQIGLTHTRFTKDDWYEATGSLTYTYTSGVDVYPNVSGLTEGDFTVLNSHLNGTYLGDIYQELSEQYNLGRYRIMALPHKKCMSWHADKNKRIHIPVVTNEKCKLVINDQAYYLEEGYTYLADTTNYHTAFNADPSLLRLNLLIDVIS